MSVYPHLYLHITSKLVNNDTNTNYIVPNITPTHNTPSSIFFPKIYSENENYQQMPYFT